MPRENPVFACPECGHEDECVDFGEPITGTEHGSYDIDSDHHEYDGDTDLDRSGDRYYRCRECDYEFSYVELRRNVISPSESEPDESAGFSAEEGEGSGEVIGIKSDATCAAINGTHSAECTSCRTIILGAVGRKKFVVCPNYKCGLEFDPAAIINLTPAR